MTVLSSGDRETLSLPAREVLTVVAGTLGSANVTRLGDIPGEFAQGMTPVGNGETKVIGPFAVPSRHEIECTGGSVSYSKAPADFALKT